MLPNSTTPTNPYGINSQDELYDMIMVCHTFNPKVPSDVAFVESRVRPETIAAEDVLLDMGVISMMSSDSQAMGRVGETWLRNVQVAAAMKAARGKLPEDSADNDNFRVLRYVAKMTINPAIAQGISHLVGSVAPGKIADLVLGEPAFFGAKPKMVIKGGGLGAEPVEVLIRSAVELGHAVGNQHWPAVVKGSTLYVPLTVDRKVMDSVMRTHDFAGITHEFVPGTEVIAYLAPHESRRLFGGANATPHTHLPANLG